MPTADAMHSLPYVLPSQPHTGLRFFAQNAGLGWQVPGASAAPQMSPAAHLQN